VYAETPARPQIPRPLPLAALSDITPLFPPSEDEIRSWTPAPSRLFLTPPSVVPVVVTPKSQAPCYQCVTRSLTKTPGVGHPERILGESRASNRVQLGLPHVAPRCESCSLLNLRKRSSMALFAPLYASTLTLLSESDELTHMESNSCTKSRKVRVEQRTSGESVIPGQHGAMPADSHYLLTSLVLCFVLGGQALAGASAGASAGAGTVRALGPSRSTMIWLSLARSW